jgi:hypothetical protein
LAERNGAMGPKMQMRHMRLFGEVARILWLCGGQNEPVSDHKRRHPGLGQGQRMADPEY